MNRGTACMNFEPAGSILGMDHVPGWSEKLNALGQFSQNPSAGAASFGLTGGRPNALDSSTKKHFQLAYYALEESVPLPDDTLDELQRLVGHVDMCLLPERGAVVQVHRDPASVFALAAIEMAIVSQNHPQVRHCAVCGGPMTGHGNAKTCDPACKRTRKQQTDRKRYRRLTRP
jgi:hypothetical protein